MTTTTWYDELTKELNGNSEDWNKVEHCTLTDEQLKKEFDDSWGSTEGAPFTLWTENYVYFPACYDGSEWVASVSRHPNTTGTNHIGGG